MTLFKSKLIALFSLIFLLASCGGSSEMDFVEIKSILLQKKGLIAGIELGESLEDIKNKKIKGFVLDDRPIRQKTQLLRRTYGSDWVGNQIYISMYFEDNKVKSLELKIHAELAENRIKLKQFVSEIFNHYDARFKRTNGTTWEFESSEGKTMQIIFHRQVLGEKTDQQTELINIQTYEKINYNNYKINKASTEKKTQEK